MGAMNLEETKWAWMEAIKKNMLILCVTELMAHNKCDGRKGFIVADPKILDKDYVCCCPFTGLH